MRIIGIGTDMVERARISKLLNRFGQKFIERILSSEEQQSLEKHAEPSGYIAKRFAAKEAVAKALGTGIGLVAFNEISITNLPNGKPIVNFVGKSKDYVQSFNIKDIMISLSDEKAYALAFVVIIGD
ncbi:MAG: holo-ACP synthase [Gammaproteobacteria bacterium]|jgi:holo-[acyl-carrier protein] synthase|nr:holo-ACP synthase [Gammaproteobacteria bacterium]